MMLKEHRNRPFTATETIGCRIHTKLLDPTKFVKVLMNRFIPSVRIASSSSTGARNQPPTSNNQAKAQTALSISTKETHLKKRRSSVINRLFLRWTLFNLRSVSTTSVSNVIRSSQSSVRATSVTCARIFSAIYTQVEVTSSSTMGLRVWGFVKIARNSNKCSTKKLSRNKESSLLIIWQSLTMSERWKTDKSNWRDGLTQAKGSNVATFNKPKTKAKKSRGCPNRRIL